MEHRIGRDETDAGCQRDTAEAKMGEKTTIHAPEGKAVVVSPAVGSIDYGTVIHQ